MWIIGILAIVAVAYFFFFGTEFSSGYNYVQGLKAQHGMGEGDIAPPNMVQMRALDSKLGEYEAELRMKGRAGDVQALLLLVGMERDAIASQMRIIEARSNIKDIGFYRPDCSENGSAETAKALLIESKSHANNAADKALQLAGSYPEQANFAGLESGEEYRLLMDGISESADELKAYVDSRCP